ncbi:Uncharacterized protein TCM_009866 [Theobroma cacao]|uniref:Uncharacterized protein n=1 Tax=Theobroma cacao TaxID=3641 RepID=A0A061E775_THECC|nr:Uncharacterized protein TCM_009866 [Theobroma cacao]
MRKLMLSLAGFRSAFRVMSAYRDVAAIVMGPMGVPGHQMIMRLRSLDSPMLANIVETAMACGIWWSEAPRGLFGTWRDLPEVSDAGSDRGGVVTKASREDVMVPKKSHESHIDYGIKKPCLTLSRFPSSCENKISFSPRFPPIDGVVVPALVYCRLVIKTESERAGEKEKKIIILPWLYRQPFMEQGEREKECW